MGTVNPVGPDLERVAEAADAVADDQRTVARKARSMQRKREQGWRWGRILDHEPAPAAVELLRRGARLLSRTAVAFMKMLAAALSREGESRRQIARRLGVTHQRVTALLTRPGKKGSRS